jgi:hypothetical protein
MDREALTMILHMAHWTSQANNIAERAPMEPAIGFRQKVGTIELSAGITPVFVEKPSRDQMYVDRTE